MPVAGYENTLFRARLLDEIAIATAGLRDRRVVPGNTQPTAQSRQHLVAEKAQVLGHAHAHDGWRPGERDKLYRITPSGYQWRSRVA